MITPATFFISLALSKYLLGFNYFFDAFDSFIAHPSHPERFQIFNTISPIVFLGGSFLALILNVLAVTGLKFKKENSNLVTTLLIKGNFWNLTIVLMSFLILSILVGYIIGENWQCWVGLKDKC
ncbi:MAG: hypothetical protein A2145_06620 [candidate division Zixibacteria bacterium RBG_16_40_9]|nr:MAG: hypothetical protein A2145_06620 [candidate division Zixibacteria bacterium RBG_16_40_9]